MTDTAPWNEPEGWVHTWSFPSADAPEALARLCKLPLPGVPIAVKPRPWLVRLFSWPWKPWHNARIWTATGEISFFRKEGDDERVRFKVFGDGTLRERTGRV